MAKKRISIVWVAVGLALVIAGVTAGLGVVVAHADRPPLHVMFVVPDGYRGTLQLKVTLNPKKTVAERHGVYRLVFPNDGVLNVGDKSPIWNFDRLTVENESGDAIPVAGQDATQPGQVALRNLETFSKGGRIDTKQAWYLIGTKAQMQAAFAYLAEKYGGGK